MVSIVCLVLMAGIVARVVFDVARKKNIIEYLGGFKKGKCGAVYCISLPLYFVANISDGKSVLSSFFYSVKSSVELVVLKYDLTTVSSLISENLLFRVAIFTCFFLVLINAILFVLAVWGEKVIIAFKLSGIFKKDKSVLIVVGYNKENLIVAESVGMKTILLSDATKEQKKYLYFNNILYNNGKMKKLSEVLAKFKNIEKRKISIIINSENHSDNLVAATDLLDYVAGRRALGDARLNDWLECFVFCDGTSKSLFYMIEDKSSGVIKTVNRYSIVANNLCFDSPISGFLSAKQVDRSVGIVEKDVQINHCFLGFGRGARHIFDVSLSNSQMLKKTADGVEPLLVNYSIFDSADVCGNLEHNHTYRGYEKAIEKIEDESKYYPIVRKIANMQFFRMDLNSDDFYDEIRRCFGCGENDLNVVTISLGSELLNVDIFEKLVEKSAEWQISLKFYVKVNSKKMANSVLRVLCPEDAKNVVFFGMQEDVYTFSNIAENKVEHLEYQRHILYTKKENSNMSEAEYTAEAKRSWHDELNRVKRASNYHALINLKSKFNLLGYRLEKGDCEGDNKAFLDMLESTAPAGGACMAPRDAMAWQEHTRWNAYMIGSGYVPAEKEEYLEKVKLVGRKMAGVELAKVRKHINITTMQGLEQFAKDVASITGESVESVDVIKFDYDLLDDTSKILTQLGYHLEKMD